MTPEEIATVADSWRRASADPLPLHRALARRLPGPAAERADRASWIADTVSRLTERLDHPASFMPVAAGLLARRMPVSMHELAQDRDALLGALTDFQGPLDPSEDQAWSHAIDLFAEITSSVCLDPFATSDATDPTQPTTKERGEPTMAHAMQMPSIGHVAVTVSDLQTSEEWYTRVLGVEPVLDEDTGPFRHIVYQLGNTLLGLHGFPDLSSKDAFDPRHPGLDHVSFGCADRAEISRWAAHLDDLGIEHGDIVDAGYGSGLSFHDPDNIALELFAPPAD